MFVCANTDTEASGCPSDQIETEQLANNVPIPYIIKY